MKPSNKNQSNIFILRNCFDSKVMLKVQGAILNAFVIKEISESERSVKSIGAKTVNPFKG